MCRRKRLPRTSFINPTALWARPRLLGKHDGFLAGLGFRVAAMLGALGRFDFSLLSALAGGKKVGSQAQ